MRENELAARRKQSFRPRTTVAGNGAVPNLIKDLEARGVDQVWVSDITYVARLHSSLEYRTPRQFEAVHREKKNNFFKEKVPATPFQNA
jgi:transposase InsO family protein